MPRGASLSPIHRGRRRCASVHSLLLAAVGLGAWPGVSAGQDITADFSDDATEDTTGVFLAVNSILEDQPTSGVTTVPFHAASLAMRPLQLSAGGLTGGTVELAVHAITGEADMLRVFRPNGTELTLPAVFGWNSIPQKLLLSARSTGDAIVELRQRGGARTGDEILVRVGPFPGLAGQELSLYPYFEFPQAVNDNQSLQTALDPVRHAERLGLPYDCYVVEHRSPAEWATQRLLVDVTGTVESGVVQGPGIEDNVLTVWSPPLFGDDHLGLGKPYDIVFDFGQDGMLDPGDLIDGLDWRQAGIDVMEDTTALGPLAINSFEFDDDDLFLVEGFDGGSTRTLRSRGLVIYPDPLPPGKLPLVTFSHGNTGVQSSYQGYQYLQRALASYGFVTASFDMFPAHVSLGIRWRGWLTNKNTERLIGQTSLIDHNGNPYPPMGGGVIDDKVDSRRIVTSGHSRGGEGVIVQYNQIAHPNIPDLVPPNGTVQFLTADSFLGIHSIAQVTFLSENQGSKTDDRNYLMYFGSSDSDVCGCVSSVLPTIHYNRAFGNKAMLYLYGAGHGYFNERWSCFCTGPFTMTRADVEAASLGYFLPWVMMVARGEMAGRDYFTRAPNVFRPIGTEFIEDRERLVNLYRNARRDRDFVLDDYETNFDDITLSSSGQLVEPDVRGEFEGWFFDTDPAGGYSPGEPDGGFWWETHGLIFNYNGNNFHYLQTVAPEERDLSDDTWISFITCQQADHRHTRNLPGDRDFTVVLIDEFGTESGISTASYGGIDEVYEREAGGWGSAFKTYRLRIADFENNDSGIDLKRIEKIGFRLGLNWGSEMGRLGFDDIEIVRR